MLDSVGQSVIATDLQGRIIFWNNVAEALYGWSESEVIGRNIVETITFKGYEPEADRIMESLRNGERWSGEFKVKHKDGSSFWAEVTDSPILDKHGNLVGIIGVSNDITAKKEALKERLQLLKRLEETLESITDAFLSIDDNYVITYLNAQAEKTLKKKRSEVVGKRFQDAFPEVRNTIFEKNYIKAINEKIHIEFEYNFNVPHCENWYEVRVFPREDGISIYFRVITERKNREQSLKLTQFSVDTAHLSIFWITPEGRFIYVNDTVCRELGYSRVEMLEMNIEDITEYYNTKSRKEFWDGLKQKSVQKFETVFITKDGSRLPVIVTNHFVEYQGEEYEVAFSMDISLRKQAEEAIAASESKYRMMVENMNDALLIHDFAGNILDVNHVTCELLEYARDELIGNHLSNIETSEKIRLSRGRTDTIILEGSLLFECEFRTKSGKIVPVNVSAKLVSKEGAGTIQSFVRDITELIQEQRRILELESKIQQAQKLESLAILAGGLAHDYNNLMQGIIGNAGLALMDLDPNSPSYASIQGINRSAQQAAELTKQMLAFAGRGSLEVTKIELSNLVERMKNLLKSAISKKAEISFDLSSNSTSIDGDITQIRQIVMNLVTNASEALGENPGSITVKTGSVKCDVVFLREFHAFENLPVGKYAYLSVQDTGSGMDETTVSQIFDPFFSTKFTGRGLGLAAVFGIVKRHNAGIKVDTSKGEGTTITIYFPLNLDGSVKKKTSRTFINGLRFSGNILIIENEPEVRRVMEKMLRRVGFTVITASDGEAGLKQFENNSNILKLVILDYMMPRMTGDEVYYRMKRIDENIPVILSCGFNQADTLLQFGKLGVAGFVQKPYDMKKLLEKIAEVINAATES